MSWQLSTATTEVLDDGRCRRYCLIIFAGCSSQPPPHRPMWSTFESAVSGHGSFPTSQTTCWLSVRATSRPRNRQPNRTALRSQAKRRSDRALQVQIITLPRRYACQKSMRREMRSARPLTVNNSGIDGRNGQAYHGRKTTTPNGTRPAELGSRSCEGHRAQHQWSGRVASRVRSRPGAASRKRMLRTGTEAAVANNSMRCST